MIYFYHLHWSLNLVVLCFKHNNEEKEWFIWSFLSVRLWVKLYWVKISKFFLKFQILKFEKSNQIIYIYTDDFGVFRRLILKIFLVV